MVKRRTKKTLNRRIKRINKKMSKRIKRTKNRTNKKVSKRTKKRTNKKTNQKIQNNRRMKNKRIHKLVRTTAWAPGIQVGGVDEEEVIPPIVGDLKIERKIGMGGFSSVYIGKYNGKNVAVKVFNDDTSYNIGIRGFTNTMDIKCPFLGLPDDERLNGYLAGGKFRTTGETKDKYAIILKLYSGVELFNKVQADELSSIEQVKILSDILKQLICLHDAEVVHRDIKLENVVYDYNTMTARLIDWDMAESTVDDQGNYQEWDKSDQKGTGIYCAPELVQFNGNRRDLKPGDMFAFGVMMYVMYEIRYPWSSSIQSLRGGGVGPLSRPEIFQDVRIQRFRNTPHEFQDLIQNLLSFDPGSRLTASQALDIISPKAPSIGGTGVGAEAGAQEEGAGVGAGTGITTSSGFDFPVSPSSSSDSDFGGTPRAGRATPRKAPPVRSGGTGTTGYTPQRKKPGGAAAPPPVVSSVPVPEPVIEYRTLTPEEREQILELAKLNKNELIDIAKSLSINKGIITAFEKVEDQDVKTVLPTYILKSYREEKSPSGENPGLIEWLQIKAKKLAPHLGGLAAIAAVGLFTTALANMSTQGGDLGFDDF